MNLPNLKAMQLKLLEAFKSHVKYVSSSPSFLVKSVQQVEKKKKKKISKHKSDVNTLGVRHTVQTPILFLLNFLTLATNLARKEGLLIVFVVRMRLD